MNAVCIDDTREMADVRRLMDDIDSLTQWSTDNRLYFNESKCAIFTAARTRTTIEVEYTIGTHPVERKDHVLDLGVTIDQRVSFDHHIELITSRARQMLGYIKKVSNSKFTRNTIKPLYMAYVRSRLEFASVVWSPYLDIYINDIDSVQKQLVIYLPESRRNANSFRLPPYGTKYRRRNNI